MIRKKGEKCPCYEWNKVDDSCKYCQGYNGVFEDGVDCKYSQIPNKEPKFKKGEILYYLEYHDIVSQDSIRDLKWDGFNWNYYFGRKRNPTTEEYIFSSRLKGEEKIIRNEAETLYKKLSVFKQRYGKLPNINLKLIEDK